MFGLTVITLRHFSSYPPQYIKPVCGISWTQQTYHRHYYSNSTLTSDFVCKQISQAVKTEKLNSFLVTAQLLNLFKFYVGRRFSGTVVYFYKQKYDNCTNKQNVSGTLLEFFNHTILNINVTRIGEFMGRRRSQWDRSCVLWVQIRIQ